MSAAAMVQSRTEGSPRLNARVAGFFWLVTFVAGSFSLMTYQKVIVAGNAAATAANMLRQASLFRMSVAADLLATVCYIVVTVLVYELLKPVNRKVSLLAAAFGLAGCVLGGVSFIFRLAPLSVLENTRSLTALTVDQSQALAFTLLRTGEQGSNINFLFFGLHCLLIGYLIARSTFLPRAVGALMVFAGLGWLTLCFANLLSPEVGRSLQPFLIAPGAIGELTLTLWLLIAGVNAARWKSSAAAAAERASMGTTLPAPAG